MKRLLSTLILPLALAAPAAAHFLFVVPEPGGQEAYVLLSEDLDPDDDVKPFMVSGAKLFLKNATGQVRPLALELTSEAALVDLDGEDPRVVFGHLDVGVHQSGDKPGNLIKYYTKTILGDPFDRVSSMGEALPVELVPVQHKNGMSLLFTLHGEPVGGAEVTVYLPDGSRTKALTGPDGYTEVFEQVGRYGAWTKTKMGGAGELDGKSYAEERGYATLVAEYAGVTEQVEPFSYAPLPQETSSFGAVESNGWLYVYGGHTAKTHDYDTEAVSGRFSRLNLIEGGAWQHLPGGPALQGMNLAAHGGKVYRVGGMQPRNPRGAKPDNYSMADCSRFNPETGQWEWLAPMPTGRSSHDVAVVGNTLYVIGGWDMKGRDADSEFLHTMLTLDLSDPRAVWKEVPQPFSRRALIVTVHGNRIFVIGGMDDEDEVSREVDIYDTITRKWSTGPELIGNMGFVGFASAACTLDGRVYASVAGGDLLRLTEDEKNWEFVEKHSPRIVHRLVPWRGQVLVAGGAAGGGNSDLIEAVIPGAKGVIGEAPRGQKSSVQRRKPVEAKAKPEATEKPAEVKTEPAPREVVSAEQVFCPIMTNVEVLGDEDASVVSYEGREVLLCCSKCVKKWKKDPEAYLLPEVLPQIAGMELPERAIEQTFCPVYPTRVVSKDDPTVMYKGVKVYLFNKTAVRRWNADPERYADAAILPQLAQAKNG